MFIFWTFRYNNKQPFNKELSAFFMHTARYFCLLFLIFSNNSISQSKNQLTEILWLQSNTPPFHLNSESAQTGLCDNLTEQLISSIKDVKHTRLVVPQKRINKYIREGKNVCFPCVIHKKNANQVYTYSRPTSIYPEFSIITTNQKARTLTKTHGNPINLISLLSDENFTYGQAAARRFSPHINIIIENALSHHNVSLSLSSDNESGVVIDRLRHGFLDYSLDYPFMASYFNQQQHPIKIVSIPIAQNTNSLVKGAIGCATNAPNDFANQAIKKINAALESTILESAEHQLSQRYWLSEHIDNFDKQYYQYIINVDSQTNDAPISTADQSQNKEQL